MVRFFYFALTLFAFFSGSMGARADEVTVSRRNAVVRAVERVKPAVVSIQVTYRERILRRTPVRDPFLEFFAPFYYMIPSERDRTSTGSGIIIDEEGYILTNSHIVGDPERLQRIDIFLPDGRSLSGRHVASDLYLDLVLLQVSEKHLPVAPLGDSNDILIGEWAIAIGNPFDLGPTVSIGVISALQRHFTKPQGDYYYQDMIQTDAAINPGNSGGPLLNALGEVIGINSFIYTGGEYTIGSIGIGFAIPINAARTFIDEVRQYGQVRRAWTGILYLQDLTRPLAEYLSLPSTDGALVVQVAPGSSAHQAGLERSDVIVAIDEKRVRNVDEAIAIFKSFRVDDECSLTVFRNGETLSLRMRLEELPRTGQR